MGGSGGGVVATIPNRAFWRQEGREGQDVYKLDPKPETSLCALWNPPLPLPSTRRRRPPSPRPTPPPPPPPPPPLLPPTRLLRLPPPARLAARLWRTCYWRRRWCCAVRTTSPLRCWSWGRTCCRGDRAEEVRGGSGGLGLCGVGAKAAVAAPAVRAAMGRQPRRACWRRRQCVAGVNDMESGVACKRETHAQSRWRGQQQQQRDGSSGTGSSCTSRTRSGARGCFGGEAQRFDTE